eukprot:6199596-Pleurochrysis_carterae.AAC.3
MTVISQLTAFVCPTPERGLEIEGCELNVDSARAAHTLMLSHVNEASHSLAPSPPGALCMLHIVTHSLLGVAAATMRLETRSQQLPGTLIIPVLC